MRVVRGAVGRAGALGVAAVLAVAVPAVGAGQGAVVDPLVERASVATGGVQASLESRAPAISGDGRFVAFQSAAPDLVVDDTNGVTDVFVHDRQTGTTERVSIGDDEVEANAESRNPSISADGRYVAFESVAWNLTPSDNNEKTDIFVRDRELGTTARVSQAQSGKAGSDHSANPAISADGTHVAFDSLAPKLVDGETDDNGVADVFVAELSTGAVERVSVTSDEAQVTGASQLPAISGDGSVVAFESLAPDLVPSDGNGLADVFVRDRSASTTERISLGPAAAEPDAEAVLATISDDGSLVAYSSEATNLVAGDVNAKEDVFLHDRGAGTTVLVSSTRTGVQADESSSFPQLSGDGSVVAFISRATTLIPVDTNLSEDVFVKDLGTGVIRRAAVAHDGSPPDFRSYEASLDAAGRFVAYDSVARNLVPDDTNGRRDVFVTDTSACLSGFADVTMAHPFCDEISWLGGTGIAGGYADGGFHPGDTVTRQATAAFLFRYAGEPPFALPTPPSFGDVGAAHPFRTPIEWLAGEGIAGGYADGGFHPGATVTRQAFAAFLYRFADPTFVPPLTATFPDVPVGHPFFAPIEWLAGTGVTGGYADGTFRPTAVITRQAFAAFLARYDALP